MELLAERRTQVVQTDGTVQEIACEKQSAAGSVSQRACTFCGSRVVLYPIADALHIVHGPVGCAAYTWDIRGALSSGPELHRLSFSTDMRERDVIFGGAQKLQDAMITLIAKHTPKAAFVYATCVAGAIGDDIGAVCKAVTAKTGVTCIAVSSEGFRGTKKDGYSAAVNALDQLVGTGDTAGISERSINLLGDFNVAGESWLMRKYFEKMGVQVVSVITGDGRVDDIRRAHGAKLNLVQCSGSTTGLAIKMQEKYKIPFIKVSFFGLEDTANALYDTARFWNDPDLIRATKKLVGSEMERVLPQLRAYKNALQGRKAALYVGGAFKAFSLVTALRQLGMKVVLAGTQTGGKAEYEQLQKTCDEGTVIVDDTNPSELSQFLKSHDVDLFIGGVKERPIAYKLGIGFCDHNHERKIGLAGFEGMLAFAKEVHSTIMSPVWQFTPRRANRGGC